MLTCWSNSGFDGVEEAEFEARPKIEGRRPLMLWRWVFLRDGGSCCCWGCTDGFSGATEIVCDLETRGGAPGAVRGPPGTVGDEVS